MFTTQATSSKAGILNALSLAGKNLQDAADALGITARTFKRRMESDTLTLQDVRRISDLPGIKPVSMLSPSFLGTVAA